MKRSTLGISFCLLTLVATPLISTPRALLANEGLAKLSAGASNWVMQAGEFANWSVRNGDPKSGAVNTNSPHVYKDKVITGISGGEWGVRGYISAYDMNSGIRN